MLVLTVLSAALSFSQALGQVPHIIGGVPSLHKPGLKETLGVLDARGHNASLVVTPGNLRVVENSGVCETTPGVYQASGYADLAVNQSIWFWHFAARENSDTAPLALWFNGGPGSSSMAGVFQEHGPCRITNDSSAVIPNSMSWNNKVNILYIDQPVGVGFSHGELLVDTSQKAAADVWKFLQIFFSDSRFAKYESRNLAIWTESYGGRYGPTFAAHFLRQNAAIDAGLIKGKKVNLRVLGIGNGLTDPLIQYPSYPTYATNNSLSTVAQLTSVNSLLPECEKQILECYQDDSDSVCSNAQDFCNTHVVGPLINDWDLYYIHAPSNDSYPPDFNSYINGVRTLIGAEVPFTLNNKDVYMKFALKGDPMRNTRPDLEFVINEGIHTLIYDGEADFAVNYIGVEAMVDQLQTRFSSKKKHWQSYKVAGQEAGLYKSAGIFAYLRVYGAGHTVAAYTYGNLQRGQAALQFFNQVTFGNELCST